MCNIKINKSNQSGLVSIVTVMIVIVLLSLIVISFSKLMSRDLRQALDRELATQANYAAESGMNDARAAVAIAFRDGKLDTLDTGGKCMSLSNPNAPFLKNGSISGQFNNDPDNLIRYTCVIISVKPKQIIGRIHAGESKIYVIDNGNPTALNTLYLSWENKNIGTGPQPLGTPNQLPKESAVSTEQTGMLRATLYHIANPQLTSPNASASQNNTLSNESRTHFLYSNGVGVGPTTPAQVPGISFTAGGNGKFVPGNCNPNNRKSASYLPFQQATPRYCNSKITSLEAPSGFYLLRLTALYHGLNVSIQASDSSSAPQALQGQQVDLDVTAQGNDVLKRIFGTVSTTQYSAFETFYPEYGLQSMDTVCKRIRLPKTGPSSFGSGVIDDNLTDTNVARACQHSGF
jgi:hypothetical protein